LHQGHRNLLGSPLQAQSQATRIQYACNQAFYTKRPDQA
jgi:hypothetical protein